MYQAPAKPHPQVPVLPRPLRLTSEESVASVAPHHVKVSPSYYRTRYTEPILQTLGPEHATRLRSGPISLNYDTQSPRRSPSDFLPLPAKITPPPTRMHPQAASPAANSGVPVARIEAGLQALIASFSNLDSVGLSVMTCISHLRNILSAKVSENNDLLDRNQHLACEVDRLSIQLSERENHVCPNVPPRESVRTVYVERPVQTPKPQPIPEARKPKPLQFTPPFIQSPPSSKDSLLASRLRESESVRLELSQQLGAVRAENERLTGEILRLSDSRSENAVSQQKRLEDVLRTNSELTLRCERTENQSGLLRSEIAELRKTTASLNHAHQQVAMQLQQECSCREIAQEANTKLEQDVQILDIRNLSLQEKVSHLAADNTRLNAMLSRYMNADHDQISTGLSPGHLLVTTGTQCSGETPSHFTADAMRIIDSLSKDVISLARENSKIKSELEIVKTPPKSPKSSPKSSSPKSCSSRKSSPKSKRKSPKR